MDWRSAGLLSFCGALAIFLPEDCLAHLASPGYSGLISTPNAETLQQGQLALGFSWINGPETYLFAPKTNRIYVVTVGILPGLEATLRQTQVIGWYDPEAPGVNHAFDRMFSAKYALPLPREHPRIAIGMQDIASGNFLTGARGIKPGATQYGQSTLYVVVGEHLWSWSWHLGIGTSQAFLNGLFAGLSYKLNNKAELLAEWDSTRLNTGVRLTPTPWWAIQLASLNQTTWSINSEIRVSL